MYEDNHFLTTSICNDSVFSYLLPLYKSRLYSKYYDRWQLSVHVFLHKAYYRPKARDLYRITTFG